MVRCQGGELREGGENDNVRKIENSKITLRERKEEKGLAGRRQKRKNEEIKH